MPNNNPCVNALKQLAGRQPRVSIGKLIAVLAHKRPTPYAFFGMVADDALARLIADQSDLPDASDEITALAVIDKMMERHAQNPALRVGEIMQWMVALHTCKCPAQMTSRNRPLLSY